MPNHRPKSRNLCALPWVACTVALMLGLLPVRPASTMAASRTADAPPSATAASMTIVNDPDPHLPARLPGALPVPAVHVAPANYLVTGSTVINQSPGQTVSGGSTLPI